MPEIIVVTPDFLKMNFETLVDLDAPVTINSETTKGLSFILGWDYTNERWARLLSDSDGRLLVSTGQTKTETNTSSNPTVTSSDLEILQANPDRKQVYIQNLGTDNVYLGFGETASVSDGFVLFPKMTIIEDVFIGSIHAIAASGSHILHIQEME